MHRYKQNFYFNVAYICSLIFVLITTSQTHAARKGQPNTDERNSYCKGKLDNCIKVANSDCVDTYGSFESTSLALCKSSEVKTCKGAYGSTSDCSTRDRVTRGSRKAEVVVGQKVVAAPKSSSHSPKKRFKNKALVTLPINRKIAKDSVKKRRFIYSLKMSTTSRMKSPTKSSNVAISVNDCTFYGGTVQKDKSCSSNQSCIIGNNNGCITKAVK
jgi:hypothetical protein